jgi:hypothetical protein
MTWRTTRKPWSDFVASSGRFRAQPSQYLHHL